MPDENGNYTQAEVDTLLAESKKGTDDAVARAEAAEQASEDAAKAAAETVSNAAAASDQDSAAPRDFSVTELTKAVEDGQITQEVMDQQLLLQQRRSITSEVTAEVRSELKSDAADAKVKSGITEMNTAFPDLTKRRSPLRERVLDEVDNLVENFSQPRNTTTELMAMQKVCGDPKLAARETTRTHHQHEASAGGGAPSASEEAGDEGLWSGIDPARVDHYKGLIDKGHFTGADDKNLRQELDLLRERATAA